MLFLLSADFVHCITNVLAGWLYKLAVTRTTLFPPIEEPHFVPGSNAFIQGSAYPKSSPDCSTDRFTPDLQCLVCDIPATVSCPTCDQEFCSAHLYFCADCDNQYCGNCLDDHRDHGHWTDSDTAAELGNAQYFKGVETACRYHATSLSTRNCASSPRPLHAPISQLLAGLFSMVSFVFRYLRSSSAAAYLPQCIVLMEAP